MWCDTCHGTGRFEYFDGGPQSFWDFCYQCLGMRTIGTEEDKPHCDEWLACGEMEGNGIK